jgi:hypothetical protein
MNGSLHTSLPSPTPMTLFFSGFFLPLKIIFELGKISENTF